MTTFNRRVYNLFVHFPSFKSIGYGSGITEIIRTVWCSKILQNFLAFGKIHLKFVQE